MDKVDPFGLYSLPPPETGSVIWDLDYTWADRDWMAKRPQNNGLARADDDLRDAPRLVEAQCPKRAIGR